MKNVNNFVFFDKVSKLIKNGDYDEYFTIPFMSRALLSASILGRLKKKISTGSTPILSDNEIKDCIAEVKETAVYIIALYIEKGFMIKSENGLEFTDLGYKAIKASYK
jgi:hypothetical protein